MWDGRNVEQEEQELVWYDIDLEVVPAYEVWKPESVEWAMRVNWAKVNDLVRSDLANYPVDDWEVALRSAAKAGLPDIDREGLFSLYREKIFATEFQVTGGGHRIIAMRRQGVRWALGQCYLEDVGNGVDELHAYVS